MKFFWRLKKTDSEPQGSTETASADAATAAPTTATERDSSSAGALRTAEIGSRSTEPQQQQVAEEPASNVVTLQPVRLTERIAAAAMKTVTSLAAAEPVTLVTEALKPRSPGPLPGQESSYQYLVRALAANAGGHILVLGRPGTGRRTAVMETLERERANLSRPCDWVYLASGEGRRLEAFSLPHGQGRMLAREANAAVARVRSTYQRLAVSDDFRLGLEIIDEEYRQRATKSFDLLKRRAEDQNIALMKTPEGFVLAPMHDGKVVRNDVFRALPETMQHEVEAKIGELEIELKAFLERLPQDDNAQADRITAFHHDAALRAVKPHIDAVRVAFTECGAFLDALQAVLISGIVAGDHQAAAVGRLVNAHVLEAQTAADFSERAPLVFAHDTSLAGLCGEAGHDGAGQTVIKPGALMRANGGYLVLEAWRLAADQRGWAALVACLETGEIRPSGCGAVQVDALPFAGRVLLIADEHSLAQLLAIDAGLKRHFTHVVRFSSALPRSAMGVAEYAAFAASIAAAQGLRPISASASDALYRAALARDCDVAAVPLDAHALRALLVAADVEAEVENATHIRAVHIEEATRRVSELVI